LLGLLLLLSLDLLGLDGHERDGIGWWLSFAEESRPLSAAASTASGAIRAATRAAAALLGDLDLFGLFEFLLECLLFQDRLEIGGWLRELLCCLVFRPVGMSW
jgi:hypothetical protein